MAAIKRDKRDIAFSRYIRARDGWRCQRCGTYYPEDRRQGLDCAHFYGRRNKGVRWDPDNAVALDRGCHQYFGEHPDQFKAFMFARLGEARYNALALKAKKVTKFTRDELEWVHQDIKRQLAELEGA